MKWCPGCGSSKPLDDFCKNRSTGDGLAAYCKSCHNERNRATRARSGGSRNSHLIRRYQLSAEEVEKMIAAQGGLCASCREDPATQVDHDHETGKVRGVLCDGCNGGIALFDEDIDLLRRAYLYLDGELET